MNVTTTNEPRRQTPSRRHVLLASVAICIPVLLHLIWINEPFESSLAGLTSAAYFGEAQRGFDDHGYFATGGTPLLFHLPNSPEPVAAYANHPPLPHGLLRPFYVVLGRNEAALRVPILLLLVISLAGFFQLLRNAEGLAKAWTGTAILATLPMMIAFGNSVDAPPFCLAAIIWTVLSYQRRQRNESRSTTAVFLGVALLAALTDWFAFFLAPALLLDACLFRAKQRSPLREITIIATPFVAGFALYLLWLFLVVSSDTGSATETLLSMVGRGATDKGAPDIPALPAVLSHTWRFFSFPALVLALVGIGSMMRNLVRRKPGTIDRLLLLLLITGIGPTVVFQGRAALHEFWMLTLSPAIAVAAAIGFLVVMHAALGSLKPAVHQSFSIALFALVCSSGVMMGISEHDGFRSNAHVVRGQAINSFAGRDDVVLMPTAVEQMRFYVDAPVVHLVDSQEALLRVLQVLRPWRHQSGRLLFAVAIQEQMKAQFIILDDIPIVKGTDRLVDYDHGTLLSVIELDREACFRLLDEG